MIAKNQMLTSILFLFATASCIDNSQPDTTKSGTSQMKSESWALFAEVAYGFDGRIKNYCGTY